MSYSEANTFVDDVKWRRGDEAPVELALFAFSPEVIVVGCLELPPRNARQFFVKLTAIDGDWQPMSGPEGLESFDVGSGRNFIRLPDVPAVVANSMGEIRTRIADNAELLAEKGVHRSRLRINEQIKQCTDLVAAARKSIVERTEKLEATVVAVDPNAKLAHVASVTSPFVLRKLIDSRIGPLVLEIKDAGKFTLSTPKGFASHPSALLRDAVWKDGAWTGLPHDANSADAVVEIGTAVLAEHARDFHHAGWNKVGIAKHELELEQQALDIIENKTLPTLRAALEEFDAARANAPRR